MSTGEILVFPGDKRQLEGYLARPDGNGPFPGLVIIHEVYGLNENIKDITRRFADVGYVALAVDLFARRNKAICMFRFFSQLLFHSLNNESIRDLKQALTFMATRPEVDGMRLGAVGFCLGGSFSIAWACTDERLRVIAPFYGMNPRPLEAVTRLCPVVGSYPDKDFTTAAGQKLDDALDTYHISHDIKIYSGAKHSFFNDQSPSYNAEAAQDSWQRVLAFFQEHLVAPAEAKQ
ncbi:MAG TPA: dienelactone hydrolase family protein [Ktedonobacteraceae bacterium]|jgi:carboxymethylenebutenolidase